MTNPKNCPTCGAELTAALVDAIMDPRQEESCPESAPKVTTTKSAPVITINITEPPAGPSLATLMMLGAGVKAVSA